MARRPGNPNIRDVAARTQVSATTVSHALNGRGRVQPATRERIRRLAADITLVVRASTTSRAHAPA